MGGRRWWLGAVVFGAIAAMTVTVTFFGTGRTREEALEIVVTSAVTTAAISPATVEPAAPPPEPTPPPEPPPAPDPVPRKPGGLDELADGIDLGVVLRDLDTDEDLFAHNPDQQFDSASLVKILIALDALEYQRDSDKTIMHMLATSDDAEASRMWSEGGGSRIVSNWAKRIGLAGTSPPKDPNQWGDTLTTAGDMAEIYQYLLGDADGAVVLAGLDGMASYGADGFDQRFGIPAAAGDRRWAVKQGWSCCSDHRTMHSTGLVGPDNRYVVVILTGQPVAVGVAGARTKVTDIAAFLLNER